MHSAPLFFREHKALKNKIQQIKNEKESSIGVKSNKTNGDYHDAADTEYYGYYEEHGDDYATYYDYDEDSNSASEHLGMFRSAHKGNHLPSMSCFPCHDFRPFAFSRIFSKGVPWIGCD